MTWRNRGEAFFTIKILMMMIHLKPPNLGYILLCLTFLLQIPLVQSQNIPNIQVSSSQSQSNTDPNNTINTLGLSPNLTAASRFLGQATLGADIVTIEALANQSFEQWIDLQFTEPSTYQLVDLVLDITGANTTPHNEVVWKRHHWHTAWWQYTMESPDVLRNRIALALSEIFVISEFHVLDNQPLALASYYDLLLENAFGNFRDLLNDVSFHPAMGIYLTHINNHKTDTQTGTFPDENYARELMQLFSIGLFELNLDGSRKLDAAGNFIPTYDNELIQEMAKIFTGFSWGDASQFGEDAPERMSYTLPMQLFNEEHEPGSKILLNGFVVPNRQPVDGLADVNDALDNIFNHPNIAPFITKRLIQRLVKSNPSPAYIARAASVFNNNGHGLRGDMKALIKAILLDTEARTCPSEQDGTGGMLREPMVRYVQICRALNAHTSSQYFRNTMNRFYDWTEQRPLGAPSVFNFFLPTYQPIGAIAEANLVAPEFQIANTATITGYANFLHEVLLDNIVMEKFVAYNGEPYDEVDLELDWILANNTELELANLLEQLNLLFVHGNMSEGTKQIILDTVYQIPEDMSNSLRARMLLYLVLMSPDYLVLD